MRNNFHLGFAYYPEHWPEEMWDDDLRKMKELGTTAVRIAEFAWCRMEPEEGRFEFDWLDRFFELAAQHDIGTILCTPTAAPATWIWQTYPDTAMVQENGLRSGTASRRYNCPTAPSYLRRSDIIIEQMASRYGDHPSLIGWQTDNEVNGQVCHCEHCQGACREWLKERFGTVERFNQEMGLVFWSHEVTSWDQVMIPRPLGETARGENPSITLEKRRWVAHAWTEFLGRQVDIIREHSPGRWVTHNLPGYNVNLDLFDAAAAHDFLSLDLYPSAMMNRPPRVDLGCDLMRSLQEHPPWIMELQTGSPCTGFYKAPIPRPGQLRHWVHQCLAHGMEGVTYFRWRKSPFGVEELGNGLFDQDNRPGRRFEEVRQLGQELERLAEVLPSYETPREVAIVYDFADKAIAQAHQYKFDLEFMAHLTTWHQILRSLGLNVHFVRPTDDLSEYALVIAPWQLTASDDAAANYTRYVSDGGTLVGMLRLGYFDRYGKSSQQSMPGGMTELFGVDVEEYERVMEPNPNRVVFADEIGGAADCRDWNYILNDRGARALATYERDYYAGRTAISVNEVGSGRAIYMGTLLDRPELKRFAAHLAQVAGLESLPDGWPEEVESVRLGCCAGGGQSPEDSPRPTVRVLLNRSADTQPVALPESMTDILDGSTGTSFEIEPHGVRWLRP